MKKLFAAILLACAVAACTNVPYKGPAGCNAATQSIPNCGNGGGDE